MFKNFNWKTFFLAVITALLAGIGVDKSGVLDNAPEPQTEQTALAAAPLITDFSNLATDDGNCQTARFCAIYEVYAFWSQPVKIGGGGTLEYSFDVKTPYTKSIVITNDYTNAKAIAALQKEPPYVGWKVDKVISKKFVQYIKYPSSGGDKPVPDPNPPITE